MCKFYSGQIGIIGEVFEFKFQKYFLDISLELKESQFIVFLIKLVHFLVTLLKS